MARQSDFDLDAHEIVSAAVDIFEESGLDAVSMRSVSARLGVSPVPLYSRVGNKEALVDAIADRLLADLAPPGTDDETWEEYAVRWARELRVRLRQARDSRLILSLGREAYVEASLPLVTAMRRSGICRRRGDAGLPRPHVGRRRLRGGRDGRQARAAPGPESSGW